MGFGWAIVSDGRIHVAMTEGFSNSPGLDDVPPTIHMPCLLMVGEEDRQFAAVRACSAQMPDATLVTFPGHNHSGTFLNSGLALPEIRRFLQGVRASPSRTPLQPLDEVRRAHPIDQPTETLQ